MPVANSNIYKRNPSQNIVFDSVFSNVSSQTDGNLHVFCHKGSKSFQNIAFDSVFVMFPVKHTVIYTFFAITSVQKHLFLQCFQCSGIQKPCKILLCTMFFSFLAVFPLPESYQNDPKFHFNTLLRSDTQKSSKNVENTTVFWSRCEIVFGPPPPAKADIATAILTNVIEHLVLLFCPPISTPSPPKRCGRIYQVVTDIRQTLRLPGTMFSCKAPLQQLLKFRSTTRSSKRNGFCSKRNQVAFV